MTMIDPITGLPTPTGLVGAPTTQFGFTPPPYSPPLAQVASLPYGAGAGATTGLPYASAAPLARVGSLPLGAGAGTGVSSLPFSPTAPLARPSSLPMGAGVPTNSLPYSAGAGGSRAGLSGLLGRASTGNPIKYAGKGAGLVRYGLPLAAGTVASSFLNQLPGEGNVEQGLQGAALGAGAGFAVAGPLGGLVGGGIGALGGVLTNTLFGKDKPDRKAQIAEAADKLNVNADVYQAQFDLLKESGADEKEILAQISQQMLGEAQAKEQDRVALAQYKAQREVDSKYALAIQQRAFEFFQPHTQNIVNSGMMQAAQLEKIAESLPPEYAGFARLQASQAATGATRLASAYALQAGLMPQQWMMHQDLERQTELARLQYQQSVVDAQSGGSADFAALAEQLQAQS